MFDESKKENFKNVIDSAISHIETHGIFKVKTTGNFLNYFNNVQLISGLFVVATIIFASGRYVGVIDKERELTEVNNSNRLTETKYQQLIEINNNLR